MTGETNGKTASHSDPGALVERWGVHDLVADDERYRRLISLGLEPAFSEVRHALGALTGTVTAVDGALRRVGERLGVFDFTPGAGLATPVAGPTPGAPMAASPDRPRGGEPMSTPAASSLPGAAGTDERPTDAPPSPRALAEVARLTSGAGDAYDRLAAVVQALGRATADGHETTTDASDALRTAAGLTQHVLRHVGGVRWRAATTRPLAASRLVAVSTFALVLRGLGESVPDGTDADVNVTAEARGERIAVSFAATLPSDTRVRELVTVLRALLDPWSNVEVTVEASALVLLWPAAARTDIRA